MDKVNSWKIELRNALRTAGDLFASGFISESEVVDYENLLKNYAFLLPRYYAQLIDKSNPHCPIRLQAIPKLEELKTSEFLKDPLSDLKYQPVANVTHRYKNRVLLHLTQNCSMYCRFCFRKTLLNDLSNEMFDKNIEKAIAYIAGHAEIKEVIFSGGDPFLANEELLRLTLQKLEKISHLERIRFHTRVPVTLPARVDSDFLEILKIEKPIIVVTHFNHPKEITPESTLACQKMIAQNILLLNQSVLLKSVNDSVEALEEMYQKLFSIRVMPYYLHHPDKSLGTEHFYLSQDLGKEIMHTLKQRLPGYLLPKYVVDTGSETYKEILA
jgi:lysine 2,3-aminomutase